MADAQALRDLAQEVEGLDGPSRETEKRIWRALNPHAYGFSANQAEAYTGSIDAAAGLMPERWSPEIVHRGNLWRVWGRPSSGICVFGHGTTEAVARTACALRAIAADLEGTDAPTV